MHFGARVKALGHHSMRAYFLPAAASTALIVSAFLPWVTVGTNRLGGFPEPAGIWILVLGCGGVILAVLSIITRKNSRHPLLLVGLAALGILLTAYKLIARSADQHAWANAQAVAIVDQVAPAIPESTRMGSGIYLGLTGSLVLVLFGLTIVVKRVSRPYAEEPDDDV
jgi:hypothetical protein